MENGYEHGLYSQGSSGWTSMRNEEEFQEGDVWEVLKKINDSVETKTVSTEPSLIAKRLPTAAKMIPKSFTQKSTSQEPRMSRQSAPLNIPDWSKIYGASSKKYSSSSWLDPDINDDDEHNNTHHHHGFRGNSWESEDECQVDGGGSMIPPHEWIARRVSSFSVCEGAGRTLKGRDLSRVRNSVLTKTGFLETKSHY